MQTQEDIREGFYHKYREARYRLAEARSRLTNVQEKKKRILALEMQAAERRGVDSAAKQEREAHASGAYKSYLDEITDATLEVEKAWTEVDILGKHWEARLEVSRNKRAEMKLGG